MQIPSNWYITMAFFSTVLLWLRVFVDHFCFASWYSIDAADVDSPYISYAISIEYTNWTVAGEGLGLGEGERGESV